MKRILLIAVVAIMVFSLVACGGTSSTSSAGGDTSSTPGSSTASGSKVDGSDLKFGFVTTTTGLGDENMTDMCYEGLEMGKEDFGITFDYVTPLSDPEFETAQRTYAEDGTYDYVFLVTYSQKDAIVKNAAEFPDQKWIWFDGDIEEDNVRSIYTVWSHQTFLCGVIAGLGTMGDSGMERANDENIVGCVLGQAQPALLEGVVGFEAGVRYVNPEAEVLNVDANTFSDAGKGKEIALSMYNQGADFVQHIAGGTGIGVFDAAEEVNAYAFGVGSNQNHLRPDVIVATSLKDVRGITYSEIERIVNGEAWEGGIIEFGMANGGTGSITENSNIELPQSIIDAVEDIKQMVVDGEITPPGAEDELENWLSENTYEAK